MRFSSIDIFCKVIDNFGDAGVVYRFAREFKAAYPHFRVRVFIDDLRALHQIEPGINLTAEVQDFESIRYICMRDIGLDTAEALGTAEIMIEAFACHIPEPLMKMAMHRSSLIINLEYLSAEDWVEGYHLKESLLPEGHARKFFFMPGFTTATGGLILNSRLQRQRSELIKNRAAFLNQQISLGKSGPVDIGNKLVGTVFTYERGFDTFIKELQEIGQQTVLLIFGEKSRAGFLSSLQRLGVSVPENDFCEYGRVQFVIMPFTRQHDYDSLLCCADFNIVRGEDSLSRAVLSGKPFIWNAYLQQDRYQLVKTEALMNVLYPYFEERKFFESYRNMMIEFNSAETECSSQTTEEHYRDFFRNLNKIEHAVSKMSYFIHNNCDLVKNFGDFLRDYKN